MHSALHPAGVQAEYISHLWWLMFWVCAAVFVIVVAFLLLAILRRRGLTIAGRPAVADPAQERRMTVTIGSGIAITVVILFVFLLATFFTGRSVSALYTPDPLTIHVIGRQWWWEIQYANSDPSKIVRSANEIHIPTGSPVLLKLSSRDVIHSFWVPSLNGKRDLIPGQESDIWIHAQQPGRYEGQCAEFCGEQHAHMRLIVIAVTPEQFSTWIDRQRQPAPAPADPELMRGQEVFLGGSCVLCHTIQGTPAAAMNGPDLTHVASRQTLAAATIPNTRGHLGGWIVDSQAIKPGNHMPPNNLDGRDLQALLGYIESLK
jgi:cytochrome c oxidase subunit 2